MEMILVAIGLAISAAIAYKIIPPLFYLSKFSYPNAKFSAMPISFLKEKEINRLLESKNLEELKNNFFSKDFLMEEENAYEMQKSVEKSLFDLITMAKNDSPKIVAPFYDAYLKKIDSHAVIDAIISLKEKKEVKNLALSPENREMIEKMKNAENINEILKEYGWNVDIEKEIEEIERDVELSAISFLKNVRLPAKYKKEVDKFVKSMIDVLNIKAILRGKYYGLPIYLYGEGWEIAEWKLKEMMKVEHVNEIVSMLEGTSYFDYLKNASADFEKYGLIAFEKALDMQILKISRDIANEDAMGIGVGIRFIVEKEYEARNLKIVIKGVDAGMQAAARRLVVVE